MSTRMLALVCTALCAAVPLAHAAVRDGDHDSDDVRAQHQHSTVAYIYVSSIAPNSSVSDIVAYAASPDGRLHPVAGSPYPESVGSMAVNGKYLMGASRESAEVTAYRIESDGSLTRMASTDYAKFNNPGGPECGGAGQLYFDHTGSTLYVQEFNGSNACANTVVASFAVNKSYGDLRYLGSDVTGVFPGDWTAASFLANNVYAYSANNDDCMYYTVYGFKRAANGALNYMPFNYNLPAPPKTFRRYVPYLTAADPTNHVAMTMQPADPPGCFNAPLQLATYTADAKGNLTTTSTYANMPKALIQSPNDLKMAPSGKLLALAGQEGLQIFHFNGASPITHFTGLLTRDPISEMFWDNANHLYAISNKTGKLYVFTATPAGVHQSPGSPYSVSGPLALIVQPWPLPWSK